MSKIEINCTNCSKLFKKYSWELSASGNNFCTKSCSATFNNKASPKRRRLQKKCKRCDNIAVYQRKLCKDCAKYILSDDLLLGEVLYKAGTNRYCYVRQKARTAHPMPDACQNCGYNKHVEICHRKPISSFDLDVKISVINSKENLVYLCPNCHWEFDQGLIDI